MSDFHSNQAKLGLISPLELDGRKDIPSVKSAQFYMKNLKAMSYPLYAGKIKDAKRIPTYTHSVTSPKLCFFCKKTRGRLFLIKHTLNNAEFGPKWVEIAAGKLRTGPLHRLYEKFWNSNWYFINFGFTRLVDRYVFVSRSYKCFRLIET